MNTILFIESMLIFAPILAANQGAGLARMLDFPLAKVPVSRMYLGENKTLAAYYMGPALGGITTYLLWADRPLLIGHLLGLGAVLGDHVKSLIKRWRGIPPGEKWFWDRVDFAIGGIVTAWLLVSGFSWQHAVVIFAAAWLVHVVGNQISFWLGLRDTPH